VLAEAVLAEAVLAEAVLAATAAVAKTRAWPRRGRGRDGGRVSVRRGGRVIVGRGGRVIVGRDAALQCTYLPSNLPSVSAVVRGCDDYEF
jgi:hypothetical protein